MKTKTKNNVLEGRLFIQISILVSLLILSVQVPLANSAGQMENMPMGASKGTTDQAMQAVQSPQGTGWGQQPGGMMGPIMGQGMMGYGGMIGRGAMMGHGMGDDALSHPRA